MQRVLSTVLYVEDEESDRLLMELAFESAGLESALRMVKHGRAAVHYLSGDGEYFERERYPFPTAVLLDLNLPEMNGFEVLRWIRAHPSGITLPVVVFTSSPRVEDRETAFRLGATEFVEKGTDPRHFRGVVRMLNYRWLRLQPCESSPPSQR